MKITEYNLNKGMNKLVAVITDLHDSEPSGILKSLSARRPDVICIVGDFVHKDRLKKSPNAMKLLENCPKIASTVVSLGNHEKFMCGGETSDIKKTGAVLLNNSSANISGINFGGLTSFEYRNKLDEDDGKRITAAKTGGMAWVKRFCSLKGFKILLCHHPEYYPEFLKDAAVDLIFSGHAHGGQIRLFGRGLFAPGQGVLPKYTRGVYDGKLVVGAGLANTVKPIPRLFNGTELIYVHI